MLRFDDYSNWQAGKVLANVDTDAFIFKATEGTYFVDKTCDNFVQQAIKLGKPWGVYHFLDGSDVIKQAEYFYSNVKGYVGKGILVLDYEGYGRQGAVKAKQFLDHIYKLTGVRPWIYMNESDAASDNWEIVANDYGWWAAKYSTVKPVNNKGLLMVAWQYTDKPHDMNYFYGDKTAWAKYAAGDKSGTNPDIKPKPPVSNYHMDGTKFKAKVDLLGHFPENWSKLTGTYVAKGKEFDIVKLVSNGTTSHAILKDGTAVTLLKEYVEKIK